MLEQNISMIQMHLLHLFSVLIQWMMYGNENIDDYNPNRQRKVLIVFVDMIADIMSNKKFQVINKELFINAEN